MNLVMLFYYLTLSYLYITCPAEVRYAHLELACWLDRAAGFTGVGGRGDRPAGTSGSRKVRPGRAQALRDHTRSGGGYTCVTLPRKGKVSEMSRSVSVAMPNCNVDVE